MNLSRRFLFYQEGELVFGPRQKRISQWLSSYKRPIYIYDIDFISQRYQEMAKALGDARVFYAMKANSHLQVLQSLLQNGAGVDVVSLGEIQRAIQAGFKPAQIVYSGVGKTKHEIGEALKLDILQMNVESLPELIRIAQIAKGLGKKARVALRLNPDVSINTHPYIATGLKENKFGMELSILPRAIEVLELHSNELVLVGISLHLGSQMQDFGAFEEALQKLKPVYLQLRSQFPTSRVFDFGGGLGIFYEKQDLNLESELLGQYAAVVKRVLGDLGAELQTEPGRWLVAHAGVLVAQVQYLKETTHKQFVVLDTGMNHLLRPALYESYHEIWSLKQSSKMIEADIVGPICESADCIGKNRQICQVGEDDFVLIQDAGAYGASMASSYNLQELPMELCI